ncbi:hypothetical protein FOZ60_000755 [Perkinsus olseni]|uniref:Integrase catalytic domain-containing protein n=1 Tax=Perkinsus olseni TaxID=32597 RepID=A0A7J6P1K4_PEROL|nr:hypothetical protein FOZ60_000755 [Perkinsus olseni]
MIDLKQMSSKWCHANAGRLLLYDAEPPWHVFRGCGFAGCFDHIKPSPSSSPSKIPGQTSTTTTPEFSNAPSPQTAGQQSHRPNRRGPKKCFTCVLVTLHPSAPSLPPPIPSPALERKRCVWWDLPKEPFTTTREIREHCPEVPSLIPCQATATLANGSTEEVVGTVKLDLIFCDRVVTHDYYVVKDLQPGIIWGLRLLGRVGVAIDIGDSAEGLRVTTRVKSPAEGDSEGITQPGIVTSLNADSEEIAVRKVRRVKTPFRALLILLLYILSSLLAVMRWSSIGDRYQQHHSMTTGWPPLKPRTDGTHVDYSKAMIARLSNEQKELLRKEQSLLKSTRLRPVCDARSWNSILPSASYLGSDTSVLLTEMQLAINKLLLDGLSDTPRPGIESEPFPWRYQALSTDFLFRRRNVMLSPSTPLKRSVTLASSGKWSGGWDDLHVLSASERRTLSIVLSKIQDAKESHVHLLEDTGKSRLLVRGDASCHGYGWLVFLSNVVEDVDSAATAPLFCRARLWRATQQYWHINRRELFCSVEALLCVGDLRLKEFGIESVVLESDSRVTCGWLRGASFRAVTKSQERTSIGRLLVIASDVRVRLQLPVVVRHIAAEINADADDLSRLAQLWDLPLDDLFNSQRSGGDRSVHSACLVCCAAVLVDSTVTLAKMQCNFAETMALILHCRASKAAGYYDCALGRFRLEERDGCEILTRVVMTIGTPYSEGRSVLVHPWDDRQKTDSIIAKCHDEIGHLSAPMTLWHLRRFWWWKGIRADSKRVCMMCDHCIAAVIKGSIRVWKGNCLDHTVRSPWETVSADLAGPFVADSFNCVYCLLLCDHFSRFCLLRPLRSATSREVIRVMTEVCGTFGSMRTLRSDRGSCFASRATQSSLEALGVRVRLVTPRAPWCNGLVERRVQELKVCLRGYGLSKSRSWSSKLGSATRRMNSVVLPDLGTTPFNIMFHRSMYLGSVVPPSSVDAAVDDDELPTADELKENDEGVLLQRDWVGKVRDDREQPPEDRRQLRPVSAGQKVLVKMADGWRGPRKVLIVHDDKARVTIADKYGVERDEHRANLRVYYGTSEVQAF